MKLNQTQLNHYFKNKSHANNASNNTVYWLNCEDGYLLQDTLKKLRKYLSSTISTEKIIFHIDNHSDWNEIKAHIQTPSLFNEQQIIELHFLNKITTAQQTELITIAEQSKNNKHCICIIVYPFRIESKILQQKWMLQLDKHSIIITIWPPSHNEYPNWLRQECIRYQIQVEDFDYFCQKTMGNPGIAAQTLYKLKLQDITIATKALLVQTLDLHANYNIFDLIDNYLLGNIKQCFIILKSLKYNDNPELLILWSLRKELTILADILEKSATTHQSIPQLLQNYKLWADKKNKFNHALKNLNLDIIYKSLHKISLIEQCIKTENNNTFVWQEIEQLFLLRNNVVLFNEQ
jgi:DNA polymerase-3 subunit delta